MKYRICGLNVDSVYEPPSFAAFAAEVSGCDISIGCADMPFAVPDTPVVTLSDLTVFLCADGWVYHALKGEEQLWTNEDYSCASLFLPDEESVGRADRALLLLRTAIECHMARHGMVSLHAACVQINRQAVAFTGVSGTGKSTRAAVWAATQGAMMISGDRPALSATDTRVYGVPWDGKEQLFVNADAPLRAILDVRRGHTPLVRKLTRRQAQRVLMQQCFLPMWDSDTAMMVMQTIGRFADSGLIYRLVCDRSEESARATYDILFCSREKIAKEALDLKIREGFVLRQLVGEYMVMPTGPNVAKFQGSVVLNEVSAFVFQKLEKPISKEDLLELLLAEYDVDHDTARADLMKLLDRFREYGMLEEQP